jgi:hypothetical protein
MEDSPMKILLPLLLLCAMFTSCSKSYREARDFEELLEAETGHSFEVAKLNTETSGYVVYKDKTTGEYIAYNLNKFSRDTMTSYSQFSAVAVEGTDIVRNLARNWETRTSVDTVPVTRYEGGYYYDSYWETWEYDPYLYSYTEWVTVYENYTYYWYTGGGFRFENTGLSAGRDLETMAGLEEEMAMQVLTKAIQGQFSLSLERSQALAKLATKYGKIQNDRELSLDEKNYFAFEALGVNYSDLTEAYSRSLTNDRSEYETLIARAAQVNRTTPEHIGEFIGNFLAVETK